MFELNNSRLSANVDVTHSFYQNVLIFHFLMVPSSFYRKNYFILFFSLQLELHRLAKALESNQKCITKSNDENYPVIQNTENIQLLNEQVKSFCFFQTLLMTMIRPMPQISIRFTCLFSCIYSIRNIIRKCLLIYFIKKKIILFNILVRTLLTHFSVLLLEILLPV